jgi:4-carboxymuconolactone decarboxylase
MAEQPNDTLVSDLLASMTAQSVGASSLNPQTLKLVRIAALAAVGAPPTSYLENLGAAADVDIDIDGEQVRGVLTAIAPIVGTARITKSAGSILTAFGAALEIAELAQLTAVEDSGD